MVRYCVLDVFLLLLVILSTGHLAVVMTLHSDKLHICYYLNVKPKSPSDQPAGIDSYIRIPIATIFAYPSLGRLLILDYNGLYYEIVDEKGLTGGGGGSIDLHSSAHKRIDLRHARNGSISSRWPSLMSSDGLLPSSQYTDAILMNNNTEPYLCFHDYTQGGKCYSLNGQLTSVVVDFNETMLTTASSAEFYRKFNKLKLCQKRASLMANGAFQAIFLEASTSSEASTTARTYSPDLDCSLEWRLMSDDPPVQMFVWTGTVVITNTQFAYIFPEADVTVNGSTMVQRIPLRDLFVCDLSMVIQSEGPSTEVILFFAILGVFSLILMLEFAYLLGAFELCCASIPPPSPLPMMRNHREANRSSKKRRSKRGLSKKKEEESFKKKKEASKDEELDQVAQEEVNPPSGPSESSSSASSSSTPYSAVGGIYGYDTGQSPLMAANVQTNPNYSALPVYYSVGSTAAGSNGPTSTLLQDAHYFPHPQLLEQMPLKVTSLPAGPGVVVDEQQVNYLPIHEGQSMSDGAMQLQQQQQQQNYQERSNTD